MLTVIMCMALSHGGPVSALNCVSASPFATPTALASPIAVIAAGQQVKDLGGTSLGIGITVGDGTTNDTTVLSSAINARDTIVLGNAQCTGAGTFTSGTGTFAISGTNSCCTGAGTGTCNPSGGYNIATFNNSGTFSPLGAITIPTGRDIRCGGGTGTDTANLYFRFVGTTTQVGAVFQFAGSGSIFGCGFRGFNYNTSGVPVAGNNGSAFIVTYNANNYQISNNDFNGIIGAASAMSIYNNATITFNHAEHCGYYSIQTSGHGGNTVLIDHETDSDCSCCVEGTFTTTPHITMSNGTTTFPNGNGFSQSHVSMTGESGGTANCDYSQSSLTNWTCTGTGDNPAICSVPNGTCPHYATSGLVNSGTCRLLSSNCIP